VPHTAALAAQRLVQKAADRAVTCRRSERAQDHFPSLGGQLRVGSEITCVEVAHIIDEELAYLLEILETPQASFNIGKTSHGFASGRNLLSTDACGLVEMRPDDPGESEMKC
jgi:hypothetical protein